MCNSHSTTVQNFFTALNIRMWRAYLLTFVFKNDLYYVISGKTATLDFIFHFMQNQENTANKIRSQESS